MDEYIQRILQVLVEVDEAPAYQIGKKTGMPHATAHKKLKQALEAELIQVKTEKKFRTGLMSKTYAITPYGLVAYLHDYFFKKEKVEISSVISEKISRMLFKKWQKFLKYMPESYAIHLLRNIIYDLMPWIELERFGRNENIDIETAFLEHFISHLGVTWSCRPPIWSGEAPWDEIAAFLNSEPELKVMFAKKISMTIESFKNTIIYWQKIQEKIQA